MKLDIAAIINKQSNNVNCIEIYICRSFISGENATKAIIIPVDANLTSPILGLGTGTQTKIESYWYRDMSYTYDTANDAQRVTKRSFYNDHIIQHQHGMHCMYVVVLNEDTLPSHMFPCVNEITNNNTTYRTSYRINNRMFLYHDVVGEYATGSNEKKVINTSEYLYLRYKHSQQVDLIKIQADIDRVIRILCSNSHKSSLVG